MAGKRRISGFGVAIATAASIVGGIGGLGYYLWPSSSAEATSTTQPAGNTGPARPSEQQSANLYSEDDGLSYALWEGQVLEEMDNRVVGESFKTGFDQNVYNFDLELILHVTQEEKPMMVRTLFSELSPKGQLHIERVRGIGCRIAQEFIRRAEDGKTGAAPADARAFNTRHCQQAPTTRPAGP